MGQGEEANAQVGLDDPYPLADQRQIAAELAKQRWVVYAHEWLPEGTSVEVWESQVKQLCGSEAICVELVTDFEAGVTIVMNIEAMPSLEQIEESVAAVKNRMAPART